MNYKSNEIKAGLMIFISIAVLITFLIAIFGIDYGKKTNEYWIYLQYVGGISEGSVVKFMGMDVGQVTQINLPDGKENRVGVKLEVNAKTPVKTDSRAFLTSIGLMSDQHIEINPGSPEASLLQSGSTIETKESLSFAQMTEALGDLNSQVQTLMGQINTIFNDENRAHLVSMIGGMDSLINGIHKPLTSAISNLEESSRKFAKLSDKVQKLMDKNDGNLSEFLTNLKTTTDATNELITEIRGTVQNLESLMTANHSNISETLENFQAASQNLEEFSRILKEQPWLLVRKSAPPDRKF
jgi:phospholipid/cholesterol/gamma-HCH transport system substrate-binding protein